MGRGPVEALALTVTRLPLTGGPINVDLIRHGVQYRGSW